VFISSLRNRCIDNEGLRSLTRGVSSTTKHWILMVMNLLSPLLLVYNRCFDWILEQALNNRVIIILILFIVGILSQRIVVSNHPIFLRLSNVFWSVWFCNISANLTWCTFFYFYFEIWHKFYGYIFFLLLF
jgi:hypothetical protein